MRVTSMVHAAAALITCSGSIGADTKEPAVARVQIVDPEIGAYEPGRQASQELAPAALIVPFAQGAHVVEASLDADEPG